MRGVRGMLVVTAGLWLAGCSTPTPGMLAANDPYEPMNRETLKLNGKIDHYFVIPTVGIYFFLVGDSGRRAVHNFLQNISLPTVFVNDLLQGEGRRAAQTLERFTINSSVGLAGFFDPAARHFHVPGHGEDFGQTLAVWGVGEGPYLVAPFLGPQPPRDALGLAVDTAIIDPWNYVPIKQHIWWDAGRYYFTLLDLRGQTYETVQGVQRGSVDYYASLRSLYRQLRNNEIRNGRPDAKDLPDF
ncbi:MAG TPA: VacJ family lipoprotein [Rhizomicrobium sp.]|jgi:phospholipid-binding lipoprotein MlaA|nr:VacJ family lipoprotein [Rhizomicrobium sp.]